MYVFQLIELLHFTVGSKNSYITYYYWFICTAFSDAEVDRQGIEMLSDNAQNLMSVVSDVLRVTESASICVSADKWKEIGLQWVKK